MKAALPYVAFICLLLVNIECFGRLIRSSQVHVPLSLTVPVSYSEYR
jgi:hypothetical protein